MADFVKIEVILGIFEIKRLYKKLEGKMEIATLMIVRHVGLRIYDFLMLCAG